MATINRNIEQVRKTANQMRADNVTLEDGQLGYESDTRRGKVGPGAYNSLPYKDDLNIAEADVDYAADQRDGGATGGDLATQEYVDNEILAVNQGWNDGDSLLFNDYTAKLALKADVADLPLRYKFTGDGGAATGTIGVNTFPMAVNVTNPGAGDYRFAAASGTPFTVGKTYVSVIAIDGSASLGYKLSAISDAQINIQIFDTASGTPTDPGIGYLITIETEP